MDDTLCTPPKCCRDRCTVRAIMNMLSPPRHAVASLKRCVVREWVYASYHSFVGVCITNKQKFPQVAPFSGRYFSPLMFMGPALCTIRRGNQKAYKGCTKGASSTPPLSTAGVFLHSPKFAQKQKNKSAVTFSRVLRFRSGSVRSPRRTPSTIPVRWAQHGRLS